MSTDDKIAAGRLARLGKLGKLGVKAAGAKLRGKVGHQLLANTLATELGQMKGLPMKVGQLLSYMDGLVPDEEQDTYAQALSVLRANAPPVDNAACLAQLEASLGAPRRQVFDTFDDTPLASASIGQVYAATYEGAAVCVKVQYPGIADAIRADLDNIDSLMGVTRRLMPTVDFAGVIANFKDRLVEELDYPREAALQQRFADLYQGDADLVVPGVIAPLCGEKVLVSRRLQGLTLEAFLTDATDEERDRAGMALFTFAFGSLLRHGLFHADPHPGNLLFRCQGDRLGVLDYGCVQPFGAEAIEGITALVDAACHHRNLKAPVARAFELTADDETLSVLSQIVARILEPVTAPQPYTFTRTFAASISKEVVEAKLALSTRMLTRRARFVSTADGLMFIARNLFGLANLWGQLRARGRFRDAALQMVDDARTAAAGAAQGQA